MLAGSQSRDCPSHLPFTRSLSVSNTYNNSSLCASLFCVPSWRVAKVISLGRVVTRVEPSLSLLLLLLCCCQQRFAKTTHTQATRACRGLPQLVLTFFFGPDRRSWHIGGGPCHIVRPARPMRINNTNTNMVDKITQPILLLHCCPSRNASCPLGFCIVVAP